MIPGFGGRGPSGVWQFPRDRDAVHGSGAAEDDERDVARIVPRDCLEMSLTALAISAFATWTSIVLPPRHVKAEGLGGPLVRIASARPRRGSSFTACLRSAWSQSAQVEVCIRVRRFCAPDRRLTGPDLRRHSAVRFVAARPRRPTRGSTSGSRWWRLRSTGSRSGTVLDPPLLVTPDLALVDEGMSVLVPPCRRRWRSMEPALARRCGGPRWRRRRCWKRRTAPETG